MANSNRYPHERDAVNVKPFIRKVFQTKFSPHLKNLRFWVPDCFRFSFQFHILKFHYIHLQLNYIYIITYKLNIECKIQMKLSTIESEWRGISQGGTLSVGNLIEERAPPLAIICIIRTNDFIPTGMSFHIFAPKLRNDLIPYCVVFL